MNGARPVIGIGTGLDIVLLLPALYMAESAGEIAAAGSGSVAATAIAVLFGVLPLLCVLSPFAAYRASKRNRSRIHLIAILAAPWIYAVFLVIFLFNG